MLSFSLVSLCRLRDACLLPLLLSLPLRLSHLAGFKTGICAAKPLNRPYSLLALSNNTSVVPTLAAAHARFMALYRVSAHLHHYTQYMEVSEIAEAAGSLADLVSAYNELEVEEEADDDGD